MAVQRLKYLTIYIFSIFVKKSMFHKGLIYVVELVLLAGLFSCRAYRPAASSDRAVPRYSDTEYIQRYSSLAVSEMKRTGVPASRTLAQAMIESDCGQSRLAREANNYFGIKCHDDWTGPTIRHNDDRRNECFRKYRRPEESFYDHSDFLRSGSRYSFLFSLDPTDYKAWARGLKKAGYATNPDYANMLIRKIEENNLMVYDRGYSASAKSPVREEKGNYRDTGSTAPDQVTGAGNASPGSYIMARPQRIMENNRIKYIIVKDGETRESIEDEFQLLRWELARYNELPSGFRVVPGQILYLQPKRSKAEPGKEYYTTEEGDTMYMISQKYGIKLKDLYEMNRMDRGSQPGPGTRIWLRRVKPVN